MPFPADVGDDELVVLLEFRSNRTLDAETSLAFAGAVLEVIREVVGPNAPVELLGAGTSSKWFNFKFTDIATVVGVALAIEASAMTEGTVLNRALEQADRIVHVAALALRQGDEEPRTILRGEIPALAQRDRAERRKDRPDASGSDPGRLEPPLRWLGRFAQSEGTYKFFVSEGLSYFVRLTGPRPVVHDRVIGLVGHRIYSPHVGKGRIILLEASDVNLDWQKDWIADTTAGEFHPVRIGGYLRDLQGSEDATYSMHGGPNFYTSSEPVGAGPYEFGERLISSARLIRRANGTIQAELLQIESEAAFIDRQRRDFEHIRARYRDPLNDFED